MIAGRNEQATRNVSRIRGDIEEKYINHSIVQWSWARAALVKLKMKRINFNFSSRYSTFERSPRSNCYVSNKKRAGISRKWIAAIIQFCVIQKIRFKRAVWKRLTKFLPSKIEFLVCLGLWWVRSSLPFIWK